jgi:riboflavin synthase
VFTGLIEAVGILRTREHRGGDQRLTIASQALDLTDVKLGDSIATNGVCLTVVEISGDAFVADVSQETLAHSTLRECSIGSAVNLEKALLATSRLGGHIVSGHVDDVGSVLRLARDARSVRISIEAPAALAKYIAHKGSITVDGASLTVNAVEGCVFELNIVPHTAAQTIITNYRAGTRVNLEVDVIARYLERLLSTEAQVHTASAGVTLEQVLEMKGKARR